MRIPSPTRLQGLVAITLFISLSFSRPAWGGTDRVLFSFDGPHGAAPYGGLISDSAGNLFGTTSSGGMYGAGTVFELMPNGTNYTEVVLYSFMGGNDGGVPFSSLVRNSSGDLFGTTSVGGMLGLGTVFALLPNGSGYSEVVLYSFKGGTNDGSFPTAGVVFDASGMNLYGTTEHGGSGSCADGNGTGCGVVFKVTLAGSETVLYRFTDHKDGALPIAPVIFDTTFTNLYGTTSQGGIGTCPGPGIGCGVVFKLTLAGSETVLHEFSGHGDGALPTAPLIFDNKGLLYGTASAGGNTVCTGGCGVVFRLPASGTTGFRVLHAFKRSDGAQPTAGLTFDSAITYLYGTAFQGGAHGLGVVFEVEKTGGISNFWDLHDFAGSPDDGANPFAGLLMLPSALGPIPPTRGGCPPTCAGTSVQGGASSDGTAYQVPQ